MLSQDAAADAFVGIKLYEILEQKRRLLQPICPPRPELLSVGKPKPKQSRALRPVCNPAGVPPVDTSEGSSSESEAFATPLPPRKTRTRKIVTEEVVQEMAATES